MRRMSGGNTAQYTQSSTKCAWHELVDSDSSSNESRDVCPSGIDESDMEKIGRLAVAPAEYPRDETMCKISRERRMQPQGLHANVPEHDAEVCHHAPDDYMRSKLLQENEDNNKLLALRNCP